MTRVTPFLLLLAALLAPTTASADWAYDNETPCGLLSCPKDVCLDDAPPQVIDLALHCAEYGPERVLAFGGFMTYWVWGWGEYTANYYVYNDLDDTYASVQADLSPVNDPLCATVWSHFCTNPLAYPAWQDVPDPIGAYPLDS